MESAFHSALLVLGMLNVLNLTKAAKFFKIELKRVYGFMIVSNLGPTSLNPLRR